MIIELLAIKGFASCFSSKPPQPDESEQLSRYINTVIACGRSRGRAAIEAEDRRERQRKLQDAPKAPPAPPTPTWWNTWSIGWVIVLLIVLIAGGVAVNSVSP
jgi:hypothetical protein